MRRGLWRIKCRWPEVRGSYLSAVARDTYGSILDDQEPFVVCHECMDFVDDCIDPMLVAFDASQGFGIVPEIITSATPAAFRRSDVYD